MCLFWSEKLKVNFFYAVIASCFVFDMFLSYLSIRMWILAVEFEILWDSMQLLVGSVVRIS